ncbi:MAG: CCA tRNA nucleotidyltransferase [Candidatus Omnitrophica bacterium]|nr:CCA tRNA nucleotidyltransferase [Candidatus Omnitrophota bacterium]
MLSSIPNELKFLINDLRRQAIFCNMNVYIVGGFVRDLILGVKNLDLDIVTEGDAIAFALKFADLHKGIPIVHKRFGTATVKLESGLKVDFSTARREVYPKPAHLPVVSAATLRDDLSRRDFTINALALSLNNGKIIDYFNGLADLKSHKIRVLHNLSFKDDPTRILRGIRFEQRLSFRIEQSTLRLLKEAIGEGMLEQVHPHRLRDELILTLKESNPLKQIRRIDSLTGFGFLQRGLKLNSRTYSFLIYLRNSIKWFNRNYPKRRRLDVWLIYLIGLLEPLSTAKAKNFCIRFGLRRGEVKRILSFKNSSPAFIKKLSTSKIRPSDIFTLLEPLSYETIISLKAKSKNRFFNRHICNFLDIYNGMCLFVSGRDLYSLGLPPGPKYKDIFTKVLTAKLNAEVRNKEEELLLIQKLFKKGA